MTEREMSVHSKQEVQGEERTRPGLTFVPDVDICETPDSLFLWADMPGVDEQSVEVNLAEGVLTIEGRVSLSEYENLNPIYSEYRVGNYARRFTVSSDIDGARIKGHVKNGVLELELPKAERAKPRRIEITAA